MKLISVEDRLPEFNKRVFIVLGFCLNTYDVEQEGKDPEYHYWVSIGKYCCSEKWILEVNHPINDKMFFWAEIPDINKQVSSIMNTQKENDE